MPGVEYAVRGRVQGVGFRYFVLTLAQELGLDGEVWNCWDGGVEIIASHDDQATLNEFERRLKNGPGRVSGISSSPYGLEVQPGFTVGRSR